MYESGDGQPKYYVLKTKIDGLVSHMNGIPECTATQGDAQRDARQQDQGNDGRTTSRRSLLKHSMSRAYLARCSIGMTSSNVSLDEKRSTSDARNEFSTSRKNRHCENECVNSCIYFVNIVHDGLSMSMLNVQSCDTKPGPSGAQSLLPLRNQTFGLEWRRVK